MLIGTHSHVSSHFLSAPAVCTLFSGEALNLGGWFWRGEAIAKEEAEGEESDQRGPDHYSGISLLEIQGFKNPQNHLMYFKQKVWAKHIDGLYLK